MDRRLKKYIILTFSILIPLLVTYLIASYGYHSDKFGQGAWKNEYRDEYLRFPEDATTEEQIGRNLKYGINNLYYLYDKDPVYEELVKSGEENLFKFEIYRAIFQTTVKDENGHESEENRVQYLFIIYDVQYQKIRDLFTDDKTSSFYKDINEANVPSFQIELKEILEDGADDETEPQTKSAAMSEISRIKDKGADFDTDKGEILEEGETGTGRALAVILGTVRMDSLEWSARTEVKIKAKVNVPVNEGDGNDNVIELRTLELDLGPEAGDLSGLEESYQQDVNRIGYLGWVIKKYLWWISLIALLATGLITLSFYAVYLAEEQEAAKRKKKVRIKR